MPWSDPQTMHVLALIASGGAFVAWLVWTIGGREEAAFVAALGMMAGAVLYLAG